ncbi:hypothetical protein GCM10022226_31640 [Sphaerisporangium flaviroseum]|uniref:Uncharacterized protein n=1 Tax=Sphaerisporangium flaviroseum TaxID=509199 RepID=A0ABP7I6S2_9ACTN
MHMAATDVDGEGKIVDVVPVETAEEQRGVGVVGERGHALVEQPLEDLLGNPVTRGVRGERLGVLAHGPQRGA